MTPKKKRGPMTPEHKAKISQGRKRSQAARAPKLKVEKKTWVVTEKPKRNPFASKGTCSGITHALTRYEREIDAERAERAEQARRHAEARARAIEIVRALDERREERR